MVGQTIQRFLENETITFGDVDGCQKARPLTGIRPHRLDPDTTGNQGTGQRSDPRFPTYTQVREVQKQINKRHRARSNWSLSALRWKLSVQCRRCRSTHSQNESAENGQQKQAPIARRGQRTSQQGADPAERHHSGWDTSSDRDRRGLT